MIKRILFAFILSLIMVQVVAQIGSITNVQVIQRTDGSGMVDVYFKLTGTATGYLISIEASFNGGGSYTPVATNYLSGDVGPINPGSNKHIVWSGLESFPNTYSTQAKLKIIANESGGGTAVAEVLNPATGKIWMDRNLGASRAAISSADAQAYGDLYQWGRGTDGHEKRTSGTTTTLSNSDTPGHGNFILAPNSPYDWRSPQNTNLWQGINGINNPCPSAYRLPTDAELNAERLSWSSDNANGAFNSQLKLPVAGYRGFSGGSLSNVGSFGYYWSAAVDYAFARYLGFDSSSARVFSNARAYGGSVRCLKD